MPTHRKSLIGFQLGYLDLTLVHSTGEGHANFYCEYLVNNDKYDTHYHCGQIESPTLAFDWHIFTGLYISLSGLVVTHSDAGVRGPGFNSAVA